MIRHSALTDIGCRRDLNEDALLADPKHGLFVVADGVGGRDAGEVAARIAVESFQKAAPELARALAQFAEQPEWETRNRVIELIDATCQEASRQVFDQAEVLGKQGMTTTLVVAVVGGGSAFLAHVGDSRAYLVRDGLMRQLTEDHSMVNELVRTGQMTQDEAKQSQYRNVITRAVGLYPTVQADLIAIEILPGDRLVLASDGLTDRVPHEQIEAIASQEPIDATARALVDAALAKRAPDNVTVIVVEPEPTPQSDEARARARAMEEIFLFSDLPFHTRLRVSRICEEISFVPGEELVREGEAGDAMYTLVTGEAIVRHQGIEMGRLGPGQHFGELGLLGCEPRSATVIADSFGSALVVRRKHLLEFCEREPETSNRILWKLLCTLGERLREANELAIRSLRLHQP